MAHLLEIETFPIQINARGEWLHGGKQLHPKVEALFKKSIRIDENGGYRIDLGVNKAPLEVSEAAFSVQRIEVRRDEEGEVEFIEISISDGEVEVLRPETLMQSEDNVLYCRLRRDSFEVPCRFPASAYHELAFLMDFQADSPVLRVGDEQIVFKAYDRKPLPLKS